MKGCYYVHKYIFGYQIINIGYKQMTISNEMEYIIY